MGVAYSWAVVSKRTLSSKLNCPLQLLLCPEHTQDLYAPLFHSPRAASWLPLPSLLLASCHSSEPQRCVDENNRVVDPSFCKNLPCQRTARRRQRSATTAATTTTASSFLTCIATTTAASPEVFGSAPLRRQPTLPLSGHSYSVGGTSRGGFGSSFSGGGEGGGGE